MTPPTKDGHDWGCVYHLEHDDCTCRAVTGSLSSTERGEHTLGIVERLPCPFCGSSAIVTGSRDGHHVQARCGFCFTAGPSKLDAAEAIAAWNTRHEAADLISELVGALENFCQAAEYWAGCDEGCSPDAASSEIMSSGGAWPAEAYDRARAVAAKARGGAA